MLCFQDPIDHPTDLSAKGGEGWLEGACKTRKAN